MTKTGAGSVLAGLTKKTNAGLGYGSGRPTGSFIALEKRIVFDGAAVAHAVHTFSGDPTHNHAVDHSTSVDTASHSASSPESSTSVEGMMGRLAAVFAPAPTPSPSHEIVFIDSSVPDTAAFLKGIDPHAEVVMIDPGKDGVDQIAAALAGRSNIDAIHIISHGSEANLQIGTADLNATTMRTTYAHDLAVIRKALAPGADILVYGCDFAKGRDGDAAAHELATLTHANVAASTNLTGSADLGGDFILEDKIGSIHTATIDPTGYEGVLASGPVTVFADKGTGLNKRNYEFLTFANSSLATTGITNGATATYATSDGGTLTLTFSNVVYPNNASVFKSTSFASYGKFIAGYNSSVSTTDSLGDSYNGTGSFTATFTAIDKNGVSYKPNIAFIDTETTERSGESYTVTTNGGAFQNVETVGATGYALNGVGTQAITLQGTTGTGVPILVTTGATTLNISSVIAGGFQSFEFALVKPTLNLDSGGSSHSATGDYQTTFTEKGAAIAVAHTDTTVVEPGVVTAASAKIVLTNAQAGDLLSIGTLPTSITSSTDRSVPGQITITLSGSSSLTNYQSAIEAIKFSNSSGNPSTVDRNILVSFNDGSLNSNTSTSTVHVVAVNDPPVETAPATISTNKDTAVTISGLSVSDVDANGGTETVTLSAAHGTFSLGSKTGLTFSSGTGSHDTTAVFTGTLANIDNALTNLNYTPTTAFVGSDTLSFSTNDNGNTGTGGAMTATKTIAITVNNVNPTRVGSLPSKVYNDGTSNISIQTSSGFSDSLGLPLSYTAASLPAGLSIDATTGLITGTLDHDASLKAPIATGSGATLDGQYTIVVTADDGQGGHTTQSFTLDAKNQAPVVTTATSNQSASDGQTIMPIQTASAFTDPNTGDVLTYTAAGLSPGLAIDASTGAVSGTIAATASRNGPYTVTITATDEKAAATSESFTFAVANVPPTATQPLPSQTIPDGTSGVSITTAGGFTNPLGLNSYSASGLPSGLVINATTGLISGTLDHDASKNAPPPHAGSGATLDGTYIVTVTVTDGQGGLAVQHVTIDATNQAPVVLMTTPNQQSFDGNTAALDISNVFTDPNTGDGATYTVTGLPTGLTIDLNTGRISGTISKNASGPSGSAAYHVVVTSTDDKGAATTETFDWVVKDVAPSATPTLPDVAVTDGSTVSFQTSNGFIDPLSLPLTYNATGLPHGLTIDHSTGIISGTMDSNASATPGPSYSVTVTADDGQGGTASSPFKIVSSNSALVTLTPSQQSVDGQTIAPLTTANAFTQPPGDTFGYTASGLPAGLTIDPNTGAITGTIDKSASTTGPYTVTVTATDQTNSAISPSHEAFTWTVATIPPVGTPPLPDRAVNDSQTVAITTATGFTNPLNLAYTYSATGLSTLGLTIDPNTGIISGTINHDASKIATSFTIAVTADNGRGNQATNSFTIVSTNQAPIVSIATASINVAKGTPISVDASKAFVDPNTGDTLTFTASGLPKGLTIADPTTGVITGTVDPSNPSGVYIATIVATDDKGLSTPESVAITVTASGTVSPPNIIPIPAITSPDGQLIAPIDVAGHFSDSSGLPLTLTVAGLPKGLTFDPSTGLISGTIDHDGSKIMPVGGYSITATANDGTGNVVSTVFTITATNQAPSLIASTPSPTGVVGSAVTVDASKAFVDPNTGDTIIYSAANLPAGLTIDPNTGIVSGTLDKSVASGTYAVSVTATDDKGLATPETFNIAVVAAPPVLTFLPSVVVQDGLAITAIDVAGHASDPNGYPVSLSVVGLPKGLSFDPSTGLITGTIDHDASKAMPVGGYIVSVVADDGHGGTSGTTFTITSLNTAPQVQTVTRDRVIQAGSPIHINTIKAFADPNTGDVLSFTATGLPNGLTIDPTTALISGTTDPRQTAGPYIVTVTATDDKGAATSEHFTVTVNTPFPVVTAIAPVIVDDGIAIAPINVATHFTNPTGAPLTFTVTGLPQGLSFDPATGLITGATDHDASKYMPSVGFTIIATADNGKGGFVSTVFTIKSTNQAPVPQALSPRTAMVGTAFELDASKAFVDPNVGDTLTFAASGLPKGLVIDPVSGKISGVIDPAQAAGSVTVVITATDDKGAASATPLVISLGIPPQILILDQNSALDGNGSTAPDTISGSTDLSIAARGPSALRQVESAALFAPFDVTGSAQTETGAVSQDKLGGFSPFAAEGIVLETVQAISGLAAPASLAVDRVIVGTVNGVDALGGLPTLNTTHNTVRDAVVSNGAVNSFQLDKTELSSTQTGSSTNNFLGASLPSGSDPREIGLQSNQHDQISIETLIRDNVIFIALKLPRDQIGDAQVASYEVTQLDGEPLPSWLEQSRRGLVFGKLSSDRPPIELKIVATLKSGRTIVRAVVIDSSSGQIKSATNRGSH